MQTEKQQIPMITKTGLKIDRGWTDSIIKQFLPEPDLIKKNPHYRRGSDMQLFNLEKIELIEKTEDCFPL
jgi:hypothetical protein